MSLPEDVVEKYHRAGKIVREIREEMKHFVKEGMPIIEICEKVEEFINKKDGVPAFPCNVSIDEIAAHYTSPPGDERVVPSNSLVKVDIGAHINGYIADSAVTVCFSPEHEKLAKAAEEALRVAIKTIQGGISTSKLGSAIQRIIKAYGCKPVSNLTGHQIGRYLIHTGKSVPNVPHLIGSKIKVGDVVAIEPFVTVAKAAGRVNNGNEKTIFRFVKRKSVDNLYGRRLLDYIQRNFKTLPFAERWFKGFMPQEHYLSAFQKLLRIKCLTAYPVFIEASKKPVAQAEHTVLVGKNGCEVLT